jgi:DNA polymerase-3 subunit delta
MVVENKPRVIILHGEDEFSIAQTVDSLKLKLGDSDSVSMDYVQMDGRSDSVAALEAAALTLPFFAKRRMVVYRNPLERLSEEAAQKKFLTFLKKIPSTTALVLVVDFLSSGKQKRDRGKIRWLEKWARSQPEIAYIQRFEAQKGGALANWIQKRAKALDGVFDFQAATHLAKQVGVDKRLADQEIQKLLAYVNYQRPVEYDDVAYLTPIAGETNIFAIVDAMGNRDGKAASKSLLQLLDRYEPNRIFSLVVRQFRLLLLSKEIIENGGNSQQITRKLKVHPFVAEKLVTQSRKFTLEALEAIYHKLVDIDDSVKTSQIDIRLALDTLIASLAM